MWKWIRNLFNEPPEMEEVAKYEIQHTVIGLDSLERIYNVPDNRIMYGKIVINDDGDPEIKYYKRRKLLKKTYGLKKKG